MHNCRLDATAGLDVMQALPREQEVRDAALVAIEAAVAPPWTLSENFIQCTKKDTQKMFMNISGAAACTCLSDLTKPRTRAQ
jgi:hypothetical protein